MRKQNSDFEARFISEDRARAALHIGLHDAARIAAVPEESQTGMRRTPYRHHGRRHE